MKISSIPANKNITLRERNQKHLDKVTARIMGFPDLFAERFIQRVDDLSLGFAEYGMDTLERVGNEMALEKAEEDKARLMLVK